MEIKKRNLVLVFGTPVKTEETITITNPAETLSGAEIKKAMTDIIASNALGENVQPDRIVEAKYVIQQVDTVELEEA
ncbi:DUF2922 domain-containing protein [Niameybacter massiliensis]|uniref:DUF2922 domain-containing protein n=1 Tax=Holtiella tumoricola TaxID=3018743 RepID=A0AA42DQ63_9FIRM|nr:MULTISPECIES: DUF2922 domain-containing protein [Lachnospirales]MDA3733178.1 DUF2922 domain-containing protein [Holtiella tumoricola]